MNTNKAERMRNEIPVSGSVTENILSHHKAEKNNNEIIHHYQTIPSISTFH
jgi:hypothetical protein